MSENPPPQGPTDGSPDPAPQYNPPPSYGSPPPAPGYGQPSGYGQPPVSDADRKLWAMLSHLGGIVLGFVAPLIVWAIYKDRDEFIKDQSTEALNFQITVVIAYVAASVLTVIIIGFVFYPVIWILSLVFSIIGGMAANRGERYRYPFALRLVK